MQACAELMSEVASISSISYFSAEHLTKVQELPQIHINHRLSFKFA